MNSKSKVVKIEVQATGVNFGCYAVVKDSRGRKVAETEDIRPHGMRHIAYQDGKRLAESRGWLVAE